MVGEDSLVGGDVVAIGGSVGYAVTGAGLTGAGLIGASEIGALLTGESVGESEVSTGDNVVGAELLLTTSVSSSSIKLNGSDVGYIFDYCNENEMFRTKLMTYTQLLYWHL